VPRKDVGWYSYPAIDFMTTLPDNVHVFEYGSGYSTKFWESWARHYTAVEHNRDWWWITKDWGNVAYAKDKEEYVNFIDNMHFSYKEPLYAVVIDGMWREDCAKKVLKIEEVDIVFLDDANWFYEADQILRVKFPIVIPFVGRSPGVHYRKVTSMYMKPECPRLYDCIWQEFDGTVDPHF